MNKYNLTTLENGLKVVTVPVKGNQTVSIFVFLRVGTDYETKVQNGLSHFLEHMFFKGTKKRSSFNIGYDFESIGAINNAYTHRDRTAYHSKARKDYFDHILELLSDMYFNSTFPEDEIEKERGVILGEIDLKNDNPQNFLYTVQNELAYGNQSAGRSTLGTKENIRKFKRNNFVNYVNSNYKGAKTTVVVSGDLKHKDVVKKVSKYFSSLKKGSDKKQPKPKISQKKPKILIHKKKTEQTHLSIFFHGLNNSNKDLAALNMLRVILGTGMSSRLFQTIREKLGLGYYTYSWIETYYNRGLFGVSAGVHNNRAKEAVEALLKELRRIKKDGVTKKELKKAKKFMYGVRPMGLEGTDDLAEFYGSQFAGRVDKIWTPQEMTKKEKEVSAKDVQRVAKKIIKNSKMNLAMIGPHTKSKFQKIFKL